MPTTSIQHSDALIFLDGGTPLLVGRKILKASWTYSSTNTPTVHVGFTVIFFTGSDPEDAAARVASAVDVGPNVRSVQVAVAPTSPLVVKAAVQARYAGGIASEWTVLPGTQTVTPETYPIYIQEQPARTPATAVTGTLADGASEEIDLTVAKSALITRIETSADAWVQIYSTAAFRTADVGRAITTDPEGEVGLIGEVLTDSGNLVLDLAPVFVGSNADSTPATTFYLRVTNKSGSSAAITVTLSFVKLED
jgi:hypothetical protein